MNKKLLVALILSLGFMVGNASAAIVPNHIDIVGDYLDDGAAASGLIEIDTWSESQFLSPGTYTLTGGGTATELGEKWVGIRVVRDIVVSFLAADQSKPDAAAHLLNLQVFNATDGGAMWTNDGAYTALAVAAGIDNLALFAGEYLVQVSGSIFSTSGAVPVQYGLRISTIPVPAAAWLFGTAILGFVGFRRKSKMASAAA